jgi:hypothetical protein
VGEGDFVGGEEQAVAIVVFAEKTIVPPFVVFGGADKGMGFDKAAKASLSRQRAG